jgi:phosphatidate cytidylyltransferase
VLAPSQDLDFDNSATPSIDDIEFADNEYYDDDEYDEYDDPTGLGPVGGRNLPQAIGVGLALAGLVLAAMWFGPYTTLLVVVVMALLAVLELYNAMRMAGLRPATLLGIVGTVAAPAAAYYRGDAAFPLIVALAVVFGTLWYLVGADTERPVLNLSLTILGIFWVGGLAAFAALMIRVDGGIELLLATIIITVASDTMAYIGGRAYGSRPFHHASPNKTWEGTITGFMGALFAGFAIGVTDMGTIWDGNLLPALALGAVVGVLAPMGDLAESVVKRDLGVKDMGTLLPGHGGVLDRLDGLLFALPGAFYLALVSGLI